MKTWITSELKTCGLPGMDLASVLKAGFKACDVYITGRGASAIYVVLKTIGQPGAHVALPSHLCPSVALAVIRAGHRPWYLDINLDDYNISLPDLASLPDDTIALIAPHIYGHPLQINEITRFTRKARILLIEDIAQAAGCEIDGQPLGSFGDVAIMSFHPSKLIPGKGGGALIVNNPILSLSGRLRKEVDLLPEPDDDSSTRLKNLACMINPLLNSARNGEGGEQEIAGIYLDNLDLITQRLKILDESANLNAMSNLTESLKKRRERSQRYRELIQVPGISHPILRAGSPLFRHTLRLEGENGPHLRNSLTNQLRTNGIHVSNLYYPLHLIFPERTPRVLPNTEWVADRTINLWLDDTATGDYILKTAELISSAV